METAPYKVDHNCAIAKVFVQRPPIRRQSHVLRANVLVNPSISDQDHYRHLDLSPEDLVPNSVTVEGSVVSGVTNGNVSNSTKMFALQLVLTKLLSMLTFLIDFIVFYLTLSSVNHQEQLYHQLLTIQYKLKLQQLTGPIGSPWTGNSTKDAFSIGDQEGLHKQIHSLQATKSVLVNLVVLSLLALPLHLFGYVSVSKQSLSLTVTYLILSSSLFLLQCYQFFMVEQMDLILFIWLHVFCLLGFMLFAARIYFKKQSN